jgi:hypothetical protein
MSLEDLSGEDVLVVIRALREGRESDIVRLKIRITEYENNNNRLSIRDE